MAPEEISIVVLIIVFVKCCFKKQSEANMTSPAIMYFTEFFKIFQKEISLRTMTNCVIVTAVCAPIEANAAPIAP